VFKLLVFHCTGCDRRFELTMRLPSGSGTVGHASQCECGEACTSVISAPSGWVASEERTKTQLKQRSLDHHKRVVAGKEPAPKTHH
jgi:hypothetical protein